MRTFLKIFSLIASYIVPRSKCPGLTILMYHRVTGDTSLELDLPLDTFKKQMLWLSSQRVYSLDEAVSLIEAGQNPLGYVVTFDDAYLDFFSEVFPLLDDFKIPATVYVPTDFIDNPANVPISRSIAQIELLRPVNWDMLRVLSQSPLITIGAHSVTHREFPTLHNEEVIEEVEKCNQRLHDMLGITPRHFAYPRGRWDFRTEALVTPYYRSVALAGQGYGHGALNAKRLIRVPILRSDGMQWFFHRISGRLLYEEIMVAKLKKVIKKFRGFFVNYAASG